MSYQVELAISNCRTTSFPLGGLALENGRVTAQRVQDQGWGTSDVDYALAALAAAGGAIPDALGHLQDALSHGWRGFLFANNDPAMASLHATVEYQALIRQAENM